MFIINSKRYAKIKGGGENPENVETSLVKICQCSEVTRAWFFNDHRRRTPKSLLCCGISNLFPHRKQPFRIKCPQLLSLYLSGIFPEQKLIFANKKKKVRKDLRDFNFLFDLNCERPPKQKVSSCLQFRQQQNSRDKHWKASQFPRSTEP